MTNCVKKVFFVAFILAMNLLARGENEPELLFNSNFKDNEELLGWVDVYKKDPPNSQWYQIITLDNETFLKTQDVLFGISHRLVKPFIIDDSIIEIKLTATFRKPLPGKGHPIEIALSSRESTAQDAGGPFWKGKDSGLMASGYHYNIQSSNFICWQLEGRRVIMYPSRKPFNFLAEAGKWTEWRLIYNHKEKTLSFFHDLTDEKAFLVQRNVDLSNVAINSVWISAWGTEFKDISVSCLKK